MLAFLGRTVEASTPTRYRIGNGTAEEGYVTIHGFVAVAPVIEEDQPKKHLYRCLYCEIERINGRKELTCLSPALAY